MYLHTRYFVGIDRMYYKISLVGTHVHALSFQHKLQDWKVSLSELGLRLWYKLIYILFTDANNYDLV